MKKTNETYEIEVSSPLLRPGLKVTTRVSKKYFVPAMTDLMELIREFNEVQNQVPPAK
ncbi:MAG: hypothetical protein WCT26_01480 [Candidatus Buchananbacteria bacterium]